MAEMPFESTKASEVKRKLLDAGFDSTKTLSTSAELIVWLAGLGLPIPLSAIGRRLEILQLETNTAQEKVNVSAAVEGLVEVGWGTTCRTCPYARESACPYFEPVETRFCSAVFEDFASGLASHGFNVSKEESDALTKGLSEIEKPEMSDEKDFKVKYVTLLRNGYRPQLRDIEDVSLEDFESLGPELGWKFAENIVAAASTELCFRA